MIRFFSTAWYYLHHWRPKQIWVRLPLLLCVGAFVPVMIHSTVSTYWDLDFQRTTEITFMLCIPVAAWMMSKLAQRWHAEDDE